VDRHRRLRILWRLRRGEGLPFAVNLSSRR
jgi:hypothetical protein